MNYFDEQDDGTDFRDVPDEVEGQEAQPVSVRTPQAARPPQPPVQQRAPVVQQPIEEEYEEVEETQDEDEDFTEVLTDARLRLEQGKLYEMVLNHDFFEGMEVDKKAIKNVMREIRKFAQERMEVMLGMRQAVEQVQQNAFPAEAFPFNALEVQVLKSLARTATDGATAEAEPYVPEPIAAQPRKTLKPIAVAPTKTLSAPKPIAKPATKKPLPKAPTAPVKRQKPDERIQRILREEGLTQEQIDEVFPPDYKPLDPVAFDQASDEEKLRRNREASQRLQRRVPSPEARPMPDQDQINAMYTARAQAAAAHPQMQSIMSLILNSPKK